jgi:hypothetical protein
MKAQEQPTPDQDPRKNQNDPNEKKENDRTNPGKPGNDPDQTPDREVNNPPVADPKKSDKPGKIGFSDQFLLF